MFITYRYTSGSISTIHFAYTVHILCIHTGCVVSHYGVHRQKVMGTFIMLHSYQFIIAWIGKSTDSVSYFYFISMP